MQFDNFNYFFKDLIQQARYFIFNELILNILWL